MCHEPVFTKNNILGVEICTTCGTTRDDVGPLSNYSPVVLLHGKVITIRKQVRMILKKKNYGYQDSKTTRRYLINIKPTPRCQEHVFILYFILLSLLATLMAYLKMNPRVVGPHHGETHFFSQEKLYKRGLNWYLKNFPESLPHQVFSLIYITEIYIITLVNPLFVCYWRILKDFASMLVSSVCYLRNLSDFRKYIGLPGLLLANP